MSWGSLQTPSTVHTSVKEDLVGDPTSELLRSLLVGRLRWRRRRRRFLRKALNPTSESREHVEVSNASLNLGLGVPANPGGRRGAAGEAALSEEDFSGLLLFASSPSHRNEGCYSSQLLLDSDRKVPGAASTSWA